MKALGKIILKTMLSFDIDLAFHYETFHAGSCWKNIENEFYMWGAIFYKSKKNWYLPSECVQCGNRKPVSQHMNTRGPWSSKLSRNKCWYSHVTCSCSLYMTLAFDPRSNMTSHLHSSYKNPMSLDAQWKWMLLPVLYSGLLLYF